MHTDTTVVACGSFTWTSGTGTTYTTGGNYNFFSTGANGCADTATLHLTINNVCILTQQLLLADHSPGHRAQEQLIQQAVIITSSRQGLMVVPILQHCT